MFSKAAIEEARIHSEVVRKIHKGIADICIGPRLHKKSSLLAEVDLKTLKKCVRDKILSLKRNYSELSSLKDKDFDKGVKNRLDDICNDFIKISEYYLYVKEDASLAKKALNACLQLETQKAEGFDFDGSKMKEKELSTKSAGAGQLSTRSEILIKTMQINIEDYTISTKIEEVNLDEANDDSCYRVEFANSILEMYPKTVEEIKPIEKLGVLIACLRTVLLLSKDRSQLDKIFRYLQEVLSRNLGMKNNELNSNEFILSIFLLMKGGNSKVASVELILAATAVTRLLSSLIEWTIREDNSIQNYYLTALRTSEFIEQFKPIAEHTVQKLKELMIEISKILNTDLSNVDMGEFSFMQAFNDINLILSKMHSTQPKKENDLQTPESLNRQFDNYMKHSKDSAVNTYIEQHKPQFKLSHWIVKSTYHQPVSARRAKKVYLEHKTSESFLRYQQSKLANSSRDHNLTGRERIDTLDTGRGSTETDEQAKRGVVTARTREEVSKERGAVAVGAESFR